MAIPTPNDIREVTTARLRVVLEVATPYINETLIRGAENFLTQNKISVHLKSLYRTDDTRDRFMLCQYLRDNSVESNIHAAMARQLIVFIGEEYGKHGWNVTSTPRSYNLTFEEKEKWSGEADGSETSRSDLLDFEE